VSVYLQVSLNLNSICTSEKLYVNHILKSVLDVGEIMLTSGAEVNRVEDTIQRMMCAYGCVKVDVFTITSSIVVTVRTQEEEIYTQTRRIYAYETNMTKLEMCNALSRRICRDPLDEGELKNEVQHIQQMHGYSDKVLFFAYGGISMVFSIFFGGSFSDGVASCLCGFLLFLCTKVLNRLRLQRIIHTILASMCVGLGAVLLTSLGIGKTVDLIIIGNIMLLIPGISITTSLRDMISGDLISGLQGFCDAVIRAVAIAAGFALVLWRF